MTITHVNTVSDKIKFIERIFGRGTLARNGKNFAIWCPMCAPKDRSKRKLIIRVEDDANHCWTCTWRSRSLAPLLKKFSTQHELISYRDTFMHESAKNLWLNFNEVPDTRSIRLPSDFMLLTLASKKIPDVRSLLRYLESRNISNRDMWHYKLGYSNESKWARRIIIPSFDSVGSLNYLVARAVDRQNQRYVNEDIDKTSIIFNEININWTKPLVLCEGPFDLVKCGDNATCLLGCSLNENHLLFDKIVSNNTPILLALDTPARDNSLKIARRLMSYDISVKIVDLQKYNDPGEMTKEIFALACKKSIQYNWSMQFSHNMRKASNISLSS